MEGDNETLQAMLEALQTGNQTQQDILHELQLLNENLSDFKVYTQDRNSLLDEREASSAEIPEATDIYTEQITEIRTTLSDLGRDFNAYVEYAATAPVDLHNIEFNTSYLNAFSAVTLGIVAVIAAFLFGRIVFRKL